MTVTRSLPTQHPTGLPIADERRIYMGLFARNADGTVRPGVLPAHSNPLVTGRASMGYDIGVFNAVTARTTAGAEEVANDGTVTVATTAAPSSNSRKDVIWVRCLFVFLGDATNDVVLGVTQGVASATPDKPSIPAGALELAVAEVPSTATTTLSSGVVITQSAPFTAAAGGIVWLRNAADTWAAPEGAYAFRMDTKTLMQRAGGAWASVNKRVRRIPGTASGSLAGASWVDLAAQQTIPASPFGPGVPYAVSVLAVSNATLAGNTYALRVLIDGAANAQTQVAGTGGISLDAEAQQVISNPDTTHSVAVQIQSVTGSSTVSTGATISYFIIELERADTF